ncbi:hypothetical protein IFR05_005024 [Cadophora sp. M221]|nr:hypothetical protein IFR05_005024 [Cadophora sp. M221]
MVKVSLLAALPVVTAWPGVMEMNSQLQKRVEPAPRDPLFLSNKPNTGVPTTIFNAQEQFVDVRDGSRNPFRSPTTGDLRGQCPGLNAVANHNFLPRNGNVTIAQAVDGLGKAYAMSPELSAALAVIAIALAGDPLTNTWSIGAGFPALLPLIGGNPSGIVGTHNQYEGDVSIIRGDAYLNNGRVGVFQMRSWENLWRLAEGGLTFNKVSSQSDYVTRWSKANNHCFFQAPFSGLVAPAAHHFVIHFMSNHSAEVLGGTLTREVLKSFFSVTGDAPGSFVHNQGQERIPENWYRRPGSVPHTLVGILPDPLTSNAQYQGIIGFGGNTGTVNSYAGVNLEDLTGGVSTSLSLLKATTEHASSFKPQQQAFLTRQMVLLEQSDPF